MLNIEIDNDLCIIQYYWWLDFYVITMWLFSCEVRLQAGLPSAVLGPHMASALLGSVCGASLSSSDRTGSTLTTHPPSLKHAWHTNKKHKIM